LYFLNFPPKTGMMTATTATSRADRGVVRYHRPDGAEPPTHAASGERDWKLAADRGAACVNCAAPVRSI
jgi:hypothetical protein